MQNNEQEYIQDVEHEPLTKWANEPSIRELKQDLTEASLDHNDQVEIIQKYLDNMNIEGSAKVDAPEGHSKHVPKLIRKQAEWRYAALSEPFLSSESMFKVSPKTWEDKQSAIQNELLLNHQFNIKIDKINFIDDYVRTLVDEGTAICRVGWDFQEEEYEEEVPEINFVPDENYVDIHRNLAQLKQENPNEYNKAPEEIRLANEKSIQEGIPYRPDVLGYKTVTKTRTIKNQPTVDVCDFNNVIIDPTCEGKLDKANFIIYRYESSLSALEKEGGYKNLDKIHVESSSPLADPDHQETERTNFTFSDKARKKITVYEYWGYWDINNTGVVEPFVATWVGNVLIRMEENPFPDKKLPFVKVQYLPKRKSIYGESDGELLEDNQKILGAVTRGMIDILARSANGQTGMRKDMLDPINRKRFRAGLDYEFNHNVDPRQGVYSHTFPEIPASAQFMYELQNSEAESLTGIMSYNNGVSGSALGDVAAGVRGALDAASKRELGILRRLSKGIVEIGRKFMAMNAEFLDEEEWVRVTNEQFIPVHKDELNGEFDLKLGISTPEEDNAKAQELAFMLQTNGPNADPGEVRMIRAEIARLRKMPDLAKKIEEYQPEPDPLDQEIKQLEIQKLQAEIGKIQSETIENQAEAQLDMAKAGSETAKSQNLQSDTDMKNLDYVEQESGVKQARELQKHGAQAKAQAQLKLIDAKLEELRDRRKQQQTAN